MTGLSAVRTRISAKVTLDDIVEAIIFKANLPVFPKSCAFFQQAFFRIQQAQPRLLDDFVFDESGLTPYSDELDAILFRLEASEVLHTLNPSYEDYHVHDLDALACAYDRLAEERAAIDAGAELFVTLANADASQHGQ